MRSNVLCGLDRLQTVHHKLQGRRVGLMTNPTGINNAFQSAVDIVSKAYNVTALFACEHGIRGDIQAGIDVSTYMDTETGIPVYSTYTKTHRLTDEMLDTFDVLLFDMQDVGARFYTYLYSLSYAMEECARAGKAVIVLDRINPLGGLHVSGTVLDRHFASFVGDYALPTRYGITIGEYAFYVKSYLRLDVDLTVVPLAGWKRAMYLDDTSTPWVAPSPNCPSLHAALCFTGTCIFEGTNVSEGRGTTLPFELIGAPWIDAPALEKKMVAHHLPGLHFRRASFAPTFSKHQGMLCHGVQMHVTDREAMQPVLGGLLLLDAIRELHTDEFSFIYYDDHFFIDNLLGTDAYRTGLHDGCSLIEANRSAIDQYKEKIQAFYLYQ